jgi:hypothetical protein
MKMKKMLCTLLIISGILIMTFSCKTRNVKEGMISNTDSTDIGPGLIVIGKDIITEVILNPDTLGDPWEAEKVKNFNGKLLYPTLFDNIYKHKVIVYDVFTGKPLTPEDVRKVEKEYNADISRIGKLQFLEDWYFNPVTNRVIKKIKSVTFAYSIQRDTGLPPGYKALFKLNADSK